ncbi:MAG: hypothetical protein WC291_00825, partial [Thermodesulfovibrionales bacterium]
LRTTGKGDLVPARIKSSDFVNGTAVAEVQYNRPDNFTITATTPGMKLPEPPAPPVAAAVKPEKPAPQAKAAPTPEIRKPELKKPEPVSPAAAAAVPVPEPKVAFAPAVKEEKAPVAAQKPEVQKKEKPAEVAALAPKPVEKPKAEKPVVEPKKEPKVAARKGKPVEIASLSLIETEEKTLILIHAPNLAETGAGAQTSVETAGDKVILKIRPGMNRLEKMPQFDSAYVKKITVEEDKQEKGTAIVKVELTKPVQYQLKEGKTSIVLTLTH